MNEKASKRRATSPGAGSPKGSMKKLAPLSRPEMSATPVYVDSLYEWVFLKRNMLAKVNSETSGRSPLKSGSRSARAPSVTSIESGYAGNLNPANALSPAVAWSLYHFSTTTPLRALEHAAKRRDFVWQRKLVSGII